MGRTRDAREVIKVPAGPASRAKFLPGPQRGRAVRPDALGGKACWAYTSTVPVEQSGIRAAHPGLDALSGGIHFVVKISFVTLKIRDF